MPKKPRQPFSEVAATASDPRWEKLIRRQSELYQRSDDIRSPFARDYTRILHSMAYRRLKHKTQVFYNIENDHICTRMEHVAHVESVSSTIANTLGLNTELTKAIAIGHDLGHAPFGHHGETILTALCKRYISEDSSFWHEKNGLRFVDCVELLADNYNTYRNLDLTYAVRDGIISHCGEVDDNGLKPREELIVLEEEFKKAGQFSPATWEGCVVKLSDKIAYVGRDIEDAMQLGFLDEEAKNLLRKMARANDQNAINTTVIMHNLIIDVCQNSSPECGICLSDKFMKQLNTIKQFNYDKIYFNPRFEAFKKYSELVLTQLFETLYATYEGKHSFDSLRAIRSYYPMLVSSFEKWLSRYCDAGIIPNGDLQNEAFQCENVKIYGKLETKEIYAQAIIDFIAGMTDRFAVQLFNEQISY
ncbi:MAG: HD domain-containing protein [Oscillospiraceae bacterium]|nr:HD domain-containing protein [Oscillospiraceae bacterium]